MESTLSASLHHMSAGGRLGSRLHLLLSKQYDFLNRPHMRTQASFHRRSNPKRLMHADEVVVHMKQGDHCDVVLNLLAEGIRQTGEAAHIHPHVEVLSLHIARGNVRVIRIANKVDALSAKTLRRA